VALAGSLLARMVPFFCWFTRDIMGESECECEGRESERVNNECI
jgi:hypothetical protein